MTITAPIEVIQETQEFESGFRKRVLVLKTTGEYPQLLPFEFTKERCDALNALKVGQTVTVHYDLRGNEYNGRYYVNLSAWKFDAEENGSVVIANAAREKALNGDMANQFNEDSEGDILPF
jgi:hypothetical protein